MMLKRNILSFMCEYNETKKYQKWLNQTIKMDGALGYHCISGYSTTTFYMRFIDNESMDAFEIAFKLRWS